jgi:arginine:pyruvate transaminase
LISDEVYSSLVYEGEHIHPATLPGMAQRTATINSLSKSHAMTGWRLGWVVGPTELMTHLENLGLSMLYGCPEFIQKAACVALESDLSETIEMRQQYKLRSQSVTHALADAVGAIVFKPKAGMFVMLDIRPTGLNAHQFARRLLDEWGVSVLVGDAFGRQTEGFVRIGLVEPVPVLLDACEKIKQLTKALSSEKQSLK